MKKLLILGVGLGLAGSAAAQLFTPESFTGAAFGAVTGAIIGGRHHAGAGAAIGAGAGWLLGTIAHEERVERGYYSPHYYSYYPGYGYAYDYYPGSPGYYYAGAAAENQVSPPPASGVTEAPPSTQQKTLTAEPGPVLGSASAMSSANALFGR